MSSIDRRSFLRTSAAAAALASPSLRLLGQASTAPTVALKLNTEMLGARVPGNFIGLSYELQELTKPSTFSRENTGLITLFRNLSPNGVLRIGGNTSDVGWWKPTPSSPEPKMPKMPSEVGEPGTDLSYPVTPEAVRALRGFLDATGWTCIYGLNLGTETPAASAEQAAFVQATLGPKLEYLQIGNEPDLLAPHLRDKATWDAAHYFDEWIAIVKAIRARVPDARFGLPDAASDVKWFQTVSDRLSTMPDPPKVAALSHHYYIGGPPANPNINIPRILANDPRVPKDAAVVREAAAKLHGLPYRMTEGNTCYRGGKPGVSDVFAASLWSANYALTLASLGYAGLNLHGGNGGQFVGNSLGGHLPGEELLKPGEGPHPRPFYTAIANMNGTYTPQPIYFGLQFAQQFAGATMVALDFNPGSVNATAYAAIQPTGQHIVAVINKDATQPLHIDLAGYSLAQTLTGPALDSRTAAMAEPRSFSEVSTVQPGSAVLLISTRS